jgi:hypothetical protein
LSQYKKLPLWKKISKKHGKIIVQHKIDIDDLIAQNFEGVKVNKKMVFCDDLSVVQEFTITTFSALLSGIGISLFNAWLNKRKEDSKSKNITININYNMIEPVQKASSLEKSIEKARENNSTT